MISKKSVERLVIFRLLILPPLLPDRGRQAAEIARLVGDRDVDAAGMGGIRLLAAPRDVEPALRLVGEAFERVAIDRVDRHTFSRRHDADDTVAR